MNPSFGASIDIVNLCSRSAISDKHERYFDYATSAFDDAIQDMISEYIENEDWSMYYSCRDDFLNYVREHADYLLRKKFSNGVDDFREAERYLSYESAKFMKEIRKKHTDLLQILKNSMGLSD